MVDDNTMIAFKLPPKYKRALMLVAADKGEGFTASSLLRDAVEEIVITYKDGVFLHIAAHDDEHNHSTNGSAA
jgi:hypothetical protein